MPPRAEHRVVRFSIFEADLDARELRKNGVKLRIQEQPFQILALLLEHPGEIVGREEIQRKLWPEDTFVDFEQGLNSAVKKLRESLGDSAETPRFIETVPRRGYRFLHNVNREPEAPREVPAEAPEPLPPPPVSRKKTVWWGAAAAVAIAATVSWMAYSRGKTPTASMQPVPLVSLTGIKSFPSLSPSAQQVVFAWNDGSGARFSLYEKEVGAEQILRLTNSTNSSDIDPVWSPDGREVAFARISNAQPGIYIVSALGGSERKVLATRWKADSPGLAWGRIDWSPDGRWLVFSDREHDSDPDSLYMLALDTLAVRRLTFPSFQMGDLSPRFSPDGKSVAFVRDLTGADTIFIVPTEGGNPRMVSSDKNFKDGIAWTGDGHSILFAGTSGTSMSRVDVGTGRVDRLEFGLNSSWPSIRGSRFVFAQTWENYTVVSTSLEHPDREPAKNLLSSTRFDSGPQYSPDGTRITFESSRSGRFQVWVANSDGTAPRQLTNMEGTWTGTPRWSPDGKLIAYDSHQKGDSDIYVIDADGGPPRALTTEASNEVVPSWSRDGRWIYFGSDRTGRWELFKIPVSGGGATQITHEGGFAALESPDGKTLYYAKGLTEAGLWQVSPDGGKESAVLNMPEAGYWGFWKPVEDGIYYLDTSSHPQLQFYDLATGKSRHVLDIRDPAPQTPGLGISPDRKTLLYTEVGERQNEIDLVDNFR